jgi:hypothetical protein
MGNNTPYLPFATSELASIHVGVLDCKTKHRFTSYRSKRIGGGTRSKITEFSRQSRSRLIYRARNTPGINHFITLTYPHADYASTATGGDFMTSGDVVKQHLKKIRQVFTYRGIYGLWFLEFQERGAPHFHFFVFAQLSEKDKAKIRLTWSRIVGSTCPHHPTRGCDIQILRKKHAAGAYAAKYSSKSEQKIVPERYSSVGRFWGSFGNIPDNYTDMEVYVSIRELFTMARIARKYTESRAKSSGYRLKRPNHRGLSGGSLYGAAPVLLDYLRRFYITLDNPSGMTLKALPNNNPELIRLGLANTVAKRECRGIP